MKTKPNTTVAIIPISAYKGISAEVIHCGEDNNIHLSFKEGDDFVPYGPGAWRLTPEDTIKLTKALSEAVIHSQKG